MIFEVLTKAAPAGNPESGQRRPEKTTRL